MKSTAIRPKKKSQLRGKKRTESGLSEKIMTKAKSIIGRALEWNPWKYLEEQGEQ